MYVGYCFNTYTYVCMYINIGVHAYMYIHVLQANLPAINQRPVNMEELICGGGVGGSERKDGSDALVPASVTHCTAAL